MTPAELRTVTPAVTPSAGSVNVKISPNFLGPSSVGLGAALADFAPEPFAALFSWLSAGSSVRLWQAVRAARSRAAVAAVVRVRMVSPSGADVRQHHALCRGRAMGVWPSCNPPTASDEPSGERGDIGASRVLKRVLGYCSLVLDRRSRLLSLSLEEHTSELQSH